MFDLGSIRSETRALLSSITEGTLSNDGLDAAIGLGKRRLDQDRPRVISKILAAGLNTNYVNVNTLASWADGLSVVKTVYDPAPSITDVERVDPIDPTTFKEVVIGDNIYVWFESRITRDVMILYTAPWALKDLDDAITTTISVALKNALLYTCIAHTAQTLAAKYAGQEERKLPASLVNFATKESEWRRIGSAYEKMYMEELKRSASSASPLGIIIGRRELSSDRQAWATH